MPSRRRTHPAVLGGVTLALLAGLLVVLAGPGARFGLWHFRTGFRMLEWGAYVGAAATLVSLVALVLAAARGERREITLAGAGLLLGVLLVVVPWQWRIRARLAPPIHDVTTDTRNPPEFVAVVPLRADAPNPPEYAGEEAAALQREAYPEIAPALLNLPPGAAFRHALETAEEMGWEIVAADAAEGRIEATDRTFWFGFADDVVIRVREEGENSRIDVRSKSRIGRGDAGTNARRVRAYLDRLQDPR